MDIDFDFLSGGIVTALVGSVAGAVFAHLFYHLQKKKEVIMCRREKLFDQALKLKRLCCFHYFSRPCDWELEEEIDALKSAFFVFWNSLNLFQKLRYRGVRILYRKFQEIKPVFRYVDGKPTPPPETYSVQRIELLQRMIDALSE